MKLPCAVSAALLLAAAPVAHAVIAAMSFSGMQLGPTDLADDDTLLLGLNGTNGWGTFDQLLDHSDPSKGTFKMRYWYGTQYWNGSGSPIILTSPGEQSADGFNKTYTTKERLAGLMAERMGAAVIVLEHRYWGGSSPFEVLTTENMQHLTLDNSLKDITYFAKNFNPPFDNTTGSHPSVAPWVFTGGSYSGALAGWLEALEPGTFWAYHGTSGVVQAISDFWTYYSPTMEAAPKNCSADLIKVIDHVDHILFNGSSCEKKKLKNMFRLGDLEDADFGAALLNGVATWQSTQFYSESRDGYVPFFRFCDYIEGVPPKSNSTGNSTAVRLPGPEGVGLEKAIQGYVDYVTKEMIPNTCESYGLEGFNGTYNTECYKWLNPENPLYKDLSVTNLANRQWTWMLCNEPFEWWQTGAPAGMPSFVSRTVDVAYFREQCRIMFGDGPYGLAAGDSVERLNAETGGWNHTATNGRLMYANGQYDPWLDATVSAPVSRPDGPLESSADLPVRLIPGGVHCSDLYGQNWAVNAGVKAVAEAETAQMAGWVQEFYDRKAKRTVEWRG